MIYRREIKKDEEVEQLIQKRKQNKETLLSIGSSYLSGVKKPKIVLNQSSKMNTSESKTLEVYQHTK